MSTIMTPNMNLVLPVPGSELGPAYAQENNTAFGAIDSHDHSPGKGVPITPSGMQITTDLSFLGNDATNLRSVRFTSNNSLLPAIAPDLECIYVSGVDLYYNDGNGNQIQFTSGGSIVGAPGNITGLPSGTAGVAYNSFAQKFIFNSATGVPASVDVGNAILRNLLTPANAITLGVPGSLAASYSITLPTSAPGVTSVLQMDPAGNVIASNTTPSLTMPTLNATTVAVVGAITANSAIIQTVTAPVVNTNLINVTTGGSTATITGQATSDAIIFPNGVFPSTTTFASLNGLTHDAVGIRDASGGHVTLPIVVSANTSGTGLKIVRGSVSSTATYLAGEGFTILASNPGIGLYNISFNQVFGDTPAVTITAQGTATSMSSSGRSSSGFSAQTSSTNASAFDFIAIGQRS